MKENLISDKSLIYQWYFNDNMSVIDNYRVKATVYGNPTYDNGVATFNGSTDYYNLKTIINLGAKFSVSCKFKFNTLTGDAGILGYDGSNYAIYLISGRIYFRVGNSSSYITINRDTNWHEFTLTRSGATVNAYIDSISQTIVGTPNNTQNTLVKVIGAGSIAGGDKFNGQLEYIKIWNRQLSPSEVKNNYNGKTYKSLSYKATTLFHINSDNGVIRDLTGKTTPVATNVQLPKIGSNINVMKFNGSTGNVNIGSQALVGDITFMGWVNNTNTGGSIAPNLINNGQLLVICNQVVRFSISRNAGINYSHTNYNIIKLVNTQFICITSTSTGITNFYIGDKNNPPTLSGTANQNAGTPVAGGTCYLGNRTEDDRTLNGWLNDVRMEQSILTLEEITQHYSATKYKY